jgi:SAM-dependent methyltransferase
MSIRQIIRRYVPMPTLLKGKLFLTYAPLDLWDTLCGKTDPLIPGRRKIFIGGPEYRKIGDEFFELFRRIAVVSPQDRILDIGCGIGRMARPFVKFLHPTRGRYDGFDIDRDGIRWCLVHYIDHPQFRFQWANIYNKFYNPRGSIQPDAFAFPYPDGSFDFAFATSVFTHMSPRSTSHYLKEVSRVLAPGGRAMLTAFLWNEESKSLVAQGKAIFPFHDLGDLIVKDPLIPEEAIAIRQEDWEKWLHDAGLEMDGPVHWGNWCGRARHTSGQDIVLVRKVRGATV